MIEIIGKNGIAQIMIDTVDADTVQQIYGLLNAGVTENSIVRIMPDCHAGTGCVVGYTQKLDKTNPRVCPNLLGCDIGCNISSLSMRLASPVDTIAFDKWIRETIPLGTGGYSPKGCSKKHLKEIHRDDLTLFKDVERLMKEDGKKGLEMKVPILDQLFSIGSGNHFIELGEDSKGYNWITVHSGSRNLGLAVCKIYQRLAEEYCDDKCPPELRFLDKDSPYYDRYLTCVHACQRFSKINHALILLEILKYLNKHYGYSNYITCNDSIETMHNYLDLDEMILRKGAVRANEGETILLPFNMRDGIAICKGKGNEDWNFSAPHGCGRILKRSEVKGLIDLEAAKEEMERNNIFTTSLEYSLDECADAYKSKEVIINAVEPTLEIVDFIKPFYNLHG
ncbi:MAG: RNA-splicing ligase RtcB [Smithella sp. PtaU1.Bin162]|nr:MAG: RNA-splicing ligase RtcB [Smithella sp. PtaU1.Bin162]